MSFLAFFVLSGFLLRLALLMKSAGEVAWNPLTILGVFATGTFYDTVTGLYIAPSFAVFLLFCPRRWFSRPIFQITLSALSFLTIYLILFGAVAEWLFWDEFGVRFNFIAVDYLIYTSEVLGNIRESYPLPAILMGIAVITGLVFSAFWRLGGLSRWLAHQKNTSEPHAWHRRFVGLLPFFAIPILATVFVNGRQVPSFGNAYNEELARNGLYSFMAAFRNNELNYEQFYNTLSTEEAFSRARRLLAQQNSSFVSTNLTDLTHRISNPGPEKHWNVIQITVESLSAEFLGACGNKEHLTPNLDALAEQSLFLTNFYATGTRTVRGMEALTLSLPPTPGQSIVRRPHSENLFTLGSILRSRNYDTAFIYGGYGYFDNMNEFFAGNGYRILDRSSVASTNISFANVWGACDEDVLTWSLKEADASHALQQPFFHFVMTTSNHRPFTYPDGKIDIPSHTGREGGVKYTDYAIGKFIEAARKKPWFTNTLVVVVADHCAGSAGRTDLPIKRYEIPLLIHNPALIQPRRIGTQCSQIDYAPSLLGLMNWSYDSRFFGKDVLKMAPEEERAFIATYQNLGALTREKLVALKPVRKHSLHSYIPETGALSALPQDDELLGDCIAMYQTASYVFSHGLHGAIHEP